MPNRQGSLPRFALGLVIALVAVAAFAALPASGGAPRVEKWGGVWDTKHKFGTPRLFLHQDGGEVGGTYRGGGVRGKINGELSGARNRRWRGKFHDTKGGDSRGFFDVRLQTDDVSFEGTFCFKGNFFCGDDIRWTGEKR